MIRSWHTPPGVASGRDRGRRKPPRLGHRGPPPPRRSGRTAIGDIVDRRGSRLRPTRQRRAVARRTCPGPDRGPPVTGVRDTACTPGSSTAGASSGHPRPTAASRNVSFAAQFRAWADRVADGWHRTAALLRQLADTLRRVGATGRRPIRGLRGRRPLIVGDGADRLPTAGSWPPKSAVTGGRKPAGVAWRVAFPGTACGPAALRPGHPAPEVDHSELLVAPWWTGCGRWSGG